VVPRLPRIANFDDLDPLRLEPGVSVEIVNHGQALPEADLIVLPGSKATRADLAALREAGWDIDILAHHRRGGRVLGICGGYQMLGRSVADPEGLEGAPGTSAGLGLLDVTTTLGPTKQLRLEAARSSLTGDPLTGYHMHMGETDGADRARPFARVAGEPEGALSPDGRVMGTYLHGLFAADAFRRRFIGLPPGDLNYDAHIDAILDRLADHLEAHLDLDHLLGMAR
jgi:adenosylcobyric acid synthase